MLAHPDFHNTLLLVFHSFSFTTKNLISFIRLFSILKFVAFGLGYRLRVFTAIFNNISVYHGGQFYW
jgi:hypothetical protein